MINLTFEQRKYIGNILEELAKTIDLTDSQYEDAMSRYKTIGEFLSDSKCILAPYSPKIVPQGSMRIGTVIRPVKQECEFDVDANCQLSIDTPVMQYAIKKLVGDCFKSSKIYEPMLSEKKRCWRIKYAEKSKFHLDVVPAIQDDYRFLLNLGVPEKYAKYAVLITDTEHRSFFITNTDLPKSNPEGYALWFLDVMKIQAESIRMKVAIELRMSIQDVPDFKVRTPLQRAIQLMKRHRDLMFGDDDLKPISIVINTLAALSYQEVMKVSRGGIFYDIILEIVERMPSFIQVVNGSKWIVNPVNPNENFADKWLETPQLEREFYRWHNSMLESLKSDKLQSREEDLSLFLKASYGNQSVADVFSKEKDRLATLRNAAGLISSSSAYTDAYGNIDSNTSGIKNVQHSFHFANSINIPRNGDYKFAYLSYQKNLVEGHFKFLKCFIEKKVMKCTGYLKPDGASTTYKVLIEHVIGREPKTTILEPEIEPSSKIHMYQDQSLCLSYSKETRWLDRTKVYENTVPWLAEWIIYYELYLVNGNIWEGKESPDHLTPATMNYNRDEE